MRCVRAQIDVAIVYLTAHSDQVRLARAKNAGIGAYLPKPFEEQQLAVAIEMAAVSLSIRDAVQLRDTRERTVKAHRASVMAKMEAKSAAAIGRQTAPLGLPIRS